MTDGIRITRRTLLTGITASLTESVLCQEAKALPRSQKAKSLPRAGEFVRFLDPVTENPVVRLTAVTSNSFLPRPTNRFVSIKDRFLLFSSDRTGTLAPFQVDLRNGMLMQLAKPRKLAPESVCLSLKKSLLYLLDDGALTEIVLGNRKTRVLADAVSDFCELDAPGANTSFLVIRGGRLELLSEVARTQIAEGVDEFCLARPGGRGCLFGRQTDSGGREFWYVPTPLADSAGPVKLVSGAVSNPVWTHDGQRLLFLRDVSRPNVTLSEVHSVAPEAPVEQVVTTTSQFAAFSPNEDTSVLVGASRSRAQPTVLLLLTEVKRELTLCEHRAAHPSAVSPVFSPDSKRVYFQSDHEGKSAVYSVNVEKLIEPTPDERVAFF
ncbi:MAG TPA: hypothetical protein VH302_02265 [Bryobacteraceae bacterium]|nr:hypothetical protein [Bryobacteraceae bacterium]